MKYIPSSRSPMTKGSTVASAFVMALCYFASCNLIRAEMFFGPTSTTNRFLVGTNQAVLIDSVAYANSWEGSLDCSLVVSGVTYSASLEANLIWNTGSPYLIPGPAEMLITNKCAVRFQRLTNAPVGLVLFTEVITNVTVNVPAGKTIVFFLKLCPGDNFGPLAAAITQANQSFRAQFWPRQPFEGPLSFQFAAEDNARATTPPVAAVSYWFTQDIFQDPSSLVTKIPGAPRVIVEHSVNLGSWESVAAFDSTVGTNSYYRLKMEK